MISQYWSLGRQATGGPLASRRMNVWRMSSHGVRTSKTEEISRNLPGKKSRKKIIYRGPRIRLFISNVESSRVFKILNLEIYPQCECEMQTFSDRFLSVSLFAGGSNPGKKWPLGCRCMEEVMKLRAGTERAKNQKQTNKKNREGLNRTVGWKKRESMRKGRDDKGK